MKNVTISHLQKMKTEQEKIAALTAYDASFASLFDQQGVDVMLVGDSLGMVLQGEKDTLSVTIEEMAYHTRSVAKGCQRAMLIADMPFMSYATAEQAYLNAAKLMAAGASMVKLEGNQWLASTITGLVKRGVPVCGHIGLTPQSVNVFGGFKVQGKTEEKARELIESAKELQAAGAQLLVLECVPTALASEISNILNIPVIGIGAGIHTDGQILVMHDMLGISANYMPKFSKNYLSENSDIASSVAHYISDVKQKKFPTEQHSF